MDRRKLWFVAGLVLAMTVLAAAPAGVAAAGTCAITVVPDTVHVGETFVVSATGFEPNELAIGFGGLDPNESASLSIQLDENGSLTKAVVAKSFMLGQRSINLLGQSSNCGATATVTVLPTVAAPATDTLASVKPQSYPAILPELIVVWFAGLAIGWSVSKRRRSPVAG